MKRFLEWATSRNLRLAITVAPLLLATAYLLALASDRYVSESIVTVRDNGESPLMLDGLGAILGSQGSSTLRDARMLKAHILSMDMLLKLDRKLGLRSSFSAPGADFIYRLSRQATQEKFLDYYRERVEVVLDEDSGLMHIRTQGFTPQVAFDLNRELIASSETFINESSHRLAREQMSFAEAELHKARAAVNKTRDAVLDFQNKHGVLDPLAQAQANTGVTVELQGALARQEAELKGLLNFLNEDAYQVKGLRAQIAGTRAQLKAESRRGTSLEGGAQLNTLAGEYQQLAGEFQFAQDTYKLALTAVESARVESTRKLKSLVLVESPALPQSASYPRRLYTLLSLALGLSLLYGIARLIVATIEDHLQ